MESGAALEKIKNDSFSKGLRYFVYALHRLILKADNLPKDDSSEQDKQQALFIYRKIVTLSCVPCCGVCGSMKHATKPFWCLGMRICKYCVAANLISNHVLFERYWVSMAKSVQGHVSFIELMIGDVFYFQNRLTPTQRLEFSNDRIDFPGGTRTTWWFWRPHLEKVLNFDALTQEAALKHRAAEVVMGMVRRALVLRILTGAKERATPTTLVSESLRRRRDRRSAIFKLKKIELLDRSNVYHELGLRLQNNTRLNTLLHNWEDRVTPSQFH